ncbi:ribose-phosphate pyrophosphokinase 4-like isoform X1 [Durio zibethinus]|uniref:ribose-phosphate diphosphokinase n=1 Tax=Durio zibethinus TaxID=66656 RepID=A0A6P6BGD5_DURZI|nr:ribose-phosphate pyrophosphokinase 4-like isoform X1 [Durio zibethinus]
MATRPTPFPSSFLTRKKILSRFTFFKQFSILLNDKKCSRFRCQIKSFENQPPNWNVEFLPGTQPIHLIQNSPSSSISMASDSALKTVKNVCLFYCAETKALAERIAAESDAIELRAINWRTFEDGFPNLFIPNAHGIRGKNVAFLASFSSPGLIFEQLSIIYALPKLFVSSFTLVLPFFPTGTSERMEDEGDVATAFTLARILSNIPTSRGGPTSLVTFDIHALQERFYFGDNILPCFESGIPLLKSRLQQLPDSDNISIAFPDDGAWKRFHKQLQHFPTIVCNKVRIGDQRIVRIKEGEAAGRHVVIVDDLVQSGGTLIECQRVLAANGAAKISAYVTHGIFPNRSWQRFEHDNGGTPCTYMLCGILEVSFPANFLYKKGQETHFLLVMTSSLKHIAFRKA